MNKPIEKKIELSIEDAVEIAYILECVQRHNEEVGHRDLRGFKEQIEDLMKKLPSSDYFIENDIE